MNVYEYRCPLRWGDMDAQGHLNNAVYLDYLQEARVHFLLTGPPYLKELLDTGVLVVSHQVEYLAPVVFSERGLLIRLWADSVGGSRFVIAYDVFDGDVLCARARTGAVPYDLANNTLRRLSPDEREVFSAYLNRSEPLRSVPKVTAGPDDHHYPLAVRWSDLDAYGHVNNVKYYDYIQEARIALVTERLGWGESGMWLVVRQDVEYRRPIDFRLEPYEVVTAVAAVGNRSITLSIEIRDPGSAEVYATARTVLVGEFTLTADQRDQVFGTRRP
ncbi:MAG TPA: thioesterase family protein [Propionibacteriaceae bacterium]